MTDFAKIASNAWIELFSLPQQNISLLLKLVRQGAKLGCGDCQGVLAYISFWSIECNGSKTHALELALESASKGSRYGQYMLGWLHSHPKGVGNVRDYDKSLTFFQLAAEQNLSAAQLSIGHMYHYGRGVEQSHTEALRWYQLAAAQGHPIALYNVAEFHKHGGIGIPVNEGEATRWYSLADKAGYCVASNILIK